MTRTVTALYDTRAEAEAACERLKSGVDVEGRVKILDQSSTDSSDFRSVPMDHEDRHAFGEGLKRGGYMLCAHVDEDEDADKIVALLDETNSVDLDERQDTWRNEGWQPFAATGTGIGGTGYGTETGREQNVVEEERIPIVEEQLMVGKREVNRGGARIRSYVQETPVHEQVNLREEHVSVERRPVSGMNATADIGDAAFQDRSIEMTETAEVPMVSKEARVNEEVVVRKTADQRSETIDDTVRHTEVEVDESSRDRSAMSFGRDNNATSESLNEDESSFERTDRDRGL
jgi:uncharacterized protein (TIGR02271 family)